MNWRWVAIAAVLAALVASYNAFTGRGGPDVRAGETPRQPGYFLKDAVITQTNESGAPNLKLVAERIDQERAASNINLTKVRVDFLGQSERQWLLTSDSGLVPENSRVVHFSGNVHLRPLDAPADATYLRTDALAIDTERNVAYSTNSPVDIRFGRLAMTVKRFEADLNTEKVKLESVRGRSERG